MKTIMTHLLSITLAGSLIGLATAQGAAPSEPVKSEESAKAKDLFGTLSSQPDLSIFAKAMAVSGLDELLRTGGSFTILAPTNEAFRMMPEGKLEELMKPEKRDQLVTLLSYHILPGKMPSASITTNDVTTFQGSRIVLKSASGTVWVGRGEVMRPDINASNGVIHAINMVLEPDEE